MKQFTHTLQLKTFQYFNVMFPKISDTNIKDGMLEQFQVRQLLDNEDFEATIDELELLICIQRCMQRLSGKTIKTQRECTVENLNKYYHNMFLKVHFLPFYLFFFPENVGEESDEHG